MKGKRFKLALDTKFRVEGKKKKTGWAPELYVPESLSWGYIDR